MITIWLQGFFSVSATMNQELKLAGSKIIFSHFCGKDIWITVDTCPQDMSK